MRRTLTGMIVGAALALGALPACAETVLRFNNILPATHGQVVDVFKPWAEAVAKATEGRITVSILPTSLAAPPRMFDLVESGGADIAWGVPSYNTGRFTLTKAIDLPFLGDSAEALSVAYWKVHQEMFAAADEFKGVKVLTVYATGPGTIYTRDAPPETLDGFKGKKFRTGGRTVQEVARLLGAAAVTSPSGEVHEMISRNIVDGAFFTNEAYESYKLNGVVKGQFVIPKGAYNAAVYIIMNQKAWDGLSSQDQDAIMAVSGEALARMGGKAWDKADASAVELMEKQGVRRVVADGAMLDEIRKRLAPLDDAWIEEAKQKGVDGRKALDRLRELAGGK